MTPWTDRSVGELADVKSYAIDALVNSEKAFGTACRSSVENLSGEATRQLLDIQEMLVRVAYVCCQGLKKTPEAAKEAK